MPRRGRGQRRTIRIIGPAEPLRPSQETRRALRATLVRAAEDDAMSLIEACKPHGVPAACGILREMVH